LIPFVNIHTHQIENDKTIIGITDWFTTPIHNRNKEHLYSAGIHPWYIDELNTEQQFHDLTLFAQSVYCKAIGECGLDNLRGPSLSVQIKVFEKQIQLAIQLKKPVIVHCVKAFDILLHIIKKYQHKTVFIVHGFNQNQQIATQLINHGVYLSFGNALLYEKNQKLRIIFEHIPNKCIFMENDNSLASINEIYKIASSIKKCGLNVMKEIIFANYKTVFTNE
jgi:TatD DNase family protein